MLPSSPKDIPMTSSHFGSPPKTNYLYGDSPTSSLSSPKFSRRTADTDISNKTSNFVPPRLNKGLDIFATSPPLRSQSIMENGHGSPHMSSSPITTTTTCSPSDPRSLLKAASTLIKSRNGTVLTRNTILKADHFSSGTNTNLDLHLQGGPNFRAAELDVYGVAQPTVIGLSTILSILNCHPKSVNRVSCTWFSTREEPLVYLNGYPYCLREYANPMQNMNMFWGINATRLEKVEERLKTDIIKEANSMNGLILAHQELSDGTVVPCYLAADKVQTPSEVFQEFQQQGYQLKYFRIPISPEQGPEDNYFDEYVRVIRTLEPTEPLIFNCGIGNVRTTVGIIIAQIIRRTQLIERGYRDPFIIPGYDYQSASKNTSEPVVSLELGNPKAKYQETLLRLVYVLEQALESKMSTHSAIEWALERGNIMDNLMEAIMGNYHSVVALTSVLDSGVFSKRILDEMIDRSDAVVNLREIILTNRIRYNNTTASSSSSKNNKPNGSGNGYEKNLYLEKASKALQRYFFLLCFMAYINESPNTRFETRFSSWIKARTEIWSMLQNMRRKGPRLYYFRPIEELQSIEHGYGHGSTLTLSHARFHGSSKGMFDMKGAGSQHDDIVVTEVENFIIQSRKGAVFTAQNILKVDFWYYHYLDNERQEYTVIHSRTPRQLDNINNYNHPQTHHSFYIEGASNFRRIDNTHVYGIAQPTIYGLKQVIRQLLTDRPRNERILWINLREEPIIYINGVPYVLRDRYFTLRNIRAYKGITGARLEQLEDRLKEDIVQEINNYEGRILLHGENQDGQVFSQWEEVSVDDVLTVREVMESMTGEMSEELELDTAQGNMLTYHRIPITAEKVPTYEDFDELRAIIATADLGKTALVMNCQIGLGRSTTGTVIATLLTRWVHQQSSISGSIPSQEEEEEGTNDRQRQQEKPLTIRRRNYQIINSLLRVIKHGLENKRIVDDVLDKCGLTINLRDIIEKARVQVENETDPDKRKTKIKRGIVALERYYVLICFQAYLDNTSPELLHETESFGQWMKRHPELATILKELQSTDSLESIVPVELTIPSSLSSTTVTTTMTTTASSADSNKLVIQGDGIALTSEVVHVLQARTGQVLGQNSILKHDAFPGCQKMGLREKIPGAYNFRRIPVDQVKRAVKYGGKASTVGGLAVDMDILQLMNTDYSNDGTKINSKNNDDSIDTLLAASDYQIAPPYICGCAMPNKDAIKAILKAMNAGPGGKRKVLWTCLREEPVLYINKRPYVLRLHNNPLRNLETTGIAKERVEHMERIMKRDVMEELVAYNGRLLLHGEETAEKGGFILLPTWETVPPDCVETPDQVFQSIIDEGYQVNYFRIPITDEQAPIPDVFDQFIDRMKLSNQQTDIMFNCQMGRGRTTTGMVTACLLSMIAKSNDISEIGSTSEVSLSFGDMEQSEENNDEQHRLQNGDYRVILQLISVLSHGKLAKRLTDQAINMCDHMQNLRKAIYDLKLRMDAAEMGSSKRHIAEEGFLNYLVRYFYLIVFANYLLEMVKQQQNQDSTLPIENGTSLSSSSTGGLATMIEESSGLSFKSWLKRHREILNLIKYQSKELS
ncbi:inositol hexakisphosphate-domain-containing protein [Halteromyces radiatus]|uniref:inositol hexakisphosphate-domain-containing protein n=1 Tax=Halteromyces radiatus TaxID=101107 RepID=UPI0022203D27|nr:inositol hexakisphosphate-domain-containing protein [Halteromyces radiatus]KAI8092745.1 inositol hexakisphosphate-domain-containing protein [Halteromyces radiatus]